MKIYLKYNEIEKTIPNGTYQDACDLLELMDRINPEEYDLQLEDDDLSWLQLFMVDGNIMVASAKRVDNDQLQQKFSAENYSATRVRDLLVEDFFNGERDFPYVEWNANNVDYLPINTSSGVGLNNTQEAVKAAKGGCYVATAVYGSYDCPQVWTLRRFRDNTLATTWYGRAFIRTYYAISPTIVKWFGNTNWFKGFWKGKLDQMVAALNAKGVEDTPYKDRNW